MEALFAGVGVALVTIFDENREMNTAATAALAERLVGAGVRAVVVAGTTGEAATLSGEERSALIAAVRDRLPADVPVIAGTGAPTGRQAAAFTAAAIDAGTDAVLALSPPGVRDPRGYYEAVAAAAAGFPVLAYHFPAVSAPGIAEEMLPTLPINGVKDSSGDPDRLLGEVAHYDGAVYVGSSALLTMAGAVGATGAILALANAEPERCAAAFAGDGKAQRALVDAHRAAEADFPAGVKRLVAGRWGVQSPCRVGF
jgi:4-hydroxy-tetrahydrodipicolinate synthase